MTMELTVESRLSIEFPILNAMSPVAIAFVDTALIFTASVQIQWMKISM